MERQHTAIAGLKEFCIGFLSAVVAWVIVWGLYDDGSFGIAAFMALLFLFASIITIWSAPWLFLVFVMVAVVFSWLDSYTPLRLRRHLVFAETVIWLIFGGLALEIAAEGLFTGR